MALMKKITTIIIALTMFSLGKAQDIHFSQMHMTPLLINPAASGGFVGDQRVTLNYRDQWRSVANPYTTFALAGDMAMLKGNSGHMGVGLQLFRDKAGDLGMGTTSAITSVAYHVKLTSGQYLSGGISGGISQRNIDFEGARFGDQYDGAGHNSAIATLDANPADLANFLFGDFSGGVQWSYSSSASTISSKDGIDASAGVSFMHFNRPRRSYVGSDERFYSKLVAHGMVSFGIKNTNLEIQPQGYYFLQGPSQELVAGANFRYILKEESKYTGLVKGASVALGSYYRWDDAIIIAATVEHGSYALGLSYDVNMSELRTASNRRGGFEISLRFTNPNPFLYKGTSGSVKFL